jgi:hypothetical protein
LFSGVRRDKLLKCKHCGKEVARQRVASTGLYVNLDPEEILIDTAGRGVAILTAAGKRVQGAIVEPGTTGANTVKGRLLHMFTCGKRRVRT